MAWGRSRAAETPGNIPQRFEVPRGWQGAAAIAFIVLLFLAAYVVHDGWFQGGVILLMGLANIVVALRMNEERHQRLRALRGPGWWIGWLASRAPLPVARGLWLLMSMGISALGVAAIAGAA